MKITATFSVLLVVFLFSTATATKEAVLDTDGEPLRTGVQYYIKYSFVFFGGLALGKSSKQECPEIVVQRANSWDSGMPVTFSNVDPNDDIVRLSSDLNIEFVPDEVAKLCPTTTVWKVDDYDASTGKWWVTTNGVKGNPGPNTLTSWFKIEKSDIYESVPGSYKLKFCPSVCDSCKTMCKDIGRDLSVQDGGQWRLALDSEALGWRFLKANPTIIKQVV